MVPWTHRLTIRNCMSIGSAILHKSLARVAVFYNGLPLFPQNCPSHMGVMDHHLIDGSPSNTWFLGPPESTSESVCRSVQPFCTNHGRESMYFTMDCHSPPPQNCTFLWVPWPTRVNITNGIAIGSASFAGLTVVPDRQTDRQTDRQNTLLCVKQ